MVGQLKSEGFMSLLIKMFKAWSTQGSYFCASFCVRMFLFILICFLLPLANVKKRVLPLCLCVMWALRTRQGTVLNTYPWLFLYPHAINYCPRIAALGSTAKEMKTVSVNAKPADSGRVVLCGTLRPCTAIHLQWQSLSRESSGLQLYSRGDVCVLSPTVIHIHFLNWFN